MSRKLRGDEEDWLQEVSKTPEELESYEDWLKRVHDERTRRNKDGKEALLQEESLQG